MTITFDKIELPNDELKDALKLLIAEESFTAYVAEAVTNRESAVRTTAEDEVKKANAKVDEFRENNRAMKKQIDEINEIDPEEYKRLKELGGDAAKAAEKLRAVELDHKGVVDGLEERIKTLEASETSLKEQNATDLFQFEVRNAIGEYNRDNKIPVAAGAEHLMVEQALKNRKVVDNKTVMMNPDGTEFTTDSGIGTMAEWIGGPARKSFPFLYDAPGGSGAPGNTNDGGGGSKTMTRSVFDKLPAGQQMETAKTHSIVDG